MLTMLFAARVGTFLAIAKEQVSVTSCRRRYDALGQVASGDGDIKLGRFRGERAEQKVSGARHEIRGAGLAACPAAGVGVDDRQQRRETAFTLAISSVE